MPELPEVETVARGLQKAILGRTILSVVLGKTDFIDDPAALRRYLPGRRIEAVERYGKFLMLRLSAAGGAAVRSPNEVLSAASLLVHLGMTGNLASRTAEQPEEKHTHVRLTLDDGRELRYTDPRRFGRMAYLAGAAILEELERFGADPLLVTAAAFATAVRSRRARIKALLLDQSVLRGVGNIYADESLWRAKIHPAKVGAKLTGAETKQLLRVLQEILEKAIVMRGSTIANFADGNGEPGGYQKQHRAYGRAGQKCFRCAAIIRRTIVAGRSSYYCPKCQPAPRGKKRILRKAPAGRSRLVRNA
jgi:formamidopyrimidine-DNA glycosylase